VRQIAALQAHLREDRDLTRAGLALWWDGYPVSLDVVRDALGAARDAWAGAITPYVGRSGTLTHAALRVIAAAPYARYRSALLRRMRKAVVAQRFVWVLGPLLHVAAGVGVSDPPDGLPTLCRALGGASAPALRGALVRIARRLSLPELAGGVDATDAELQAARTELQLGLRLLAGSVTRRAPASRGAAPRVLTPRGRYLPLLLLGWLSLRQDELIQDQLPRLARRAEQLADGENRDADPPGGGCPPP
jgi:hypothetical protein